VGGGYKGRGKGRHNNYNQDQVTCQICSRTDHGALDCYHRFDIRYSGPSYDFSSQPPSTPHQALVAEPTITLVNQSDWYIDSRASTHVTSDFNTLFAPQPY
jgi:hypothetical protein